MTIKEMQVRAAGLKSFIGSGEHLSYKTAVQREIDDSIALDLGMQITKFEDMFTLATLRGNREALFTTLNAFEDALSTLEEDIAKNAIAEVKAQEAINEN